jgi:hypothetical protein
MTTEEIKREYYRKTVDIENRYLDLHVPQEIQHYYLLCQFIQLKSFERYADQYGWQPIDQSLAANGKGAMSWGERLSGFELDSIKYLNAEIERRETHARRTMVQANAEPIRLYG